MATLRSFFQSWLPGRRSPDRGGAKGARGGTARTPGGKGGDLPGTGDLVAGKYLVQAKIGEGGMGAVFAAVDETLDRDVAIKFLLHRGRDGLRLFKELRREARMLASVSHPNIVQVIEVGNTERGVPFLVMERVRGRSLRLLIERLGPVDLPTAVSLAHQIARALAHAHARGIVHADLKPDNVLSNLRGLIKVTDFGLSRQLQRTRTATTDEHLRGCGTPHYMAPELFKGAESTPASDVYALGATLVELITGKSMFQRDSEELVSREEARRRALHEEPASLVESCGPLAAPLAQIVDRMVSKDPRHRPAAKLVARALKEERLRLAEHFPQAVNDDDEDDGPAPGALGGFDSIDEDAPVLSARVRAFVTAPMPPDFVPGDALPPSFAAHARTAAPAPGSGARRTDRLEGAPRRKNATDPLGAPAEERARPWWRRREGATDRMPPAAPRRARTDPMPPAAPRRDVTDPMPPAAPRRDRTDPMPPAAPRRDRTDPMPHAAPRGDVTDPLPRHDAAARPTSSGSVTFSSGAMADRSARDDRHALRASAGRGRTAQRPVYVLSVVAVGFACLSFGLVGRDLIATLRGGGGAQGPAGGEAPASGAAAAPAPSGGASPGAGGAASLGAGAAAQGAGAASASAGGHAVSAGSSVAPVVPSGSGAGAALPNVAAPRPGAAAIGATPPRPPPSGQPAAQVVDPWGQPSAAKPKQPSAAATAVPASTATPTASPRPSSVLPFGIGGN